MTLINLLVGGLAVWRISHALVKEDGPLMIFAKLRARLASSQKRSGGLFDAISCVYCTSFWTGLVGAVFTSHGLFSWIGHALAFSGVTMLLESFFSKQTNALPIIARPTGDNQVLIGGSPTPEQGDDMIRYPDASYGQVAVKTHTTLDN